MITEIDLNHVFILNTFIDKFEAITKRGFQCQESKRFLRIGSDDWPK